MLPSTLFFFQAEDGIRDHCVTGVQTCALPILYRARQPDAVIRRYLRAARKAKALLVLDIQPGRSDFFTETKRLRRWLREPGDVIGRVDAREINATTAWLDQLTRRQKLPQKLVVVHQFTDDMVDETALRARDHLDIVLNADGFGSRAVKK